MHSDDPTRNLTPGREFPATRWTLIREACGSAGEELRVGALETVCLDYWYPLYAWARSSGWSKQDAQDLIQGFFEQMLEKELLQRADPEKGRLRTFLLACLKRHAADVRGKAHAAKRDARQTISLDFEWAEGRFHDHQKDSDSPDKLYDRRWAHTLLDYSLKALRTEIGTEGRLPEYEILKSFLGFQTDETISYAKAADQLKLSEAAVKSRIFRIRKRFHELVKRQVALTVGPDTAAKDELMALLGSV